MPAPVDVLSALVGLGLIAGAGAWFLGRADLAFPLFPALGRSDWPQGVQEGDVPRFALDHLDALRRANPVDVPSIRELDRVEPCAPVERVESHVHRLDPRR